MEAAIQHSLLISLGRFCILWVMALCMVFLDSRQAISTAYLHLGWCFLGGLLKHACNAYGYNT